MFSNLFGDGRMGAIFAIIVGLCLLGLIGLYAWRVFGRGIRHAGSRGGRQSRLGIVDVFDIDRHRQLVLVRRDNIEHLIMIGGPNDLLIEGAIVRAQPSGAERRDLIGAPVSGEPRPQPPRMSFDPATAVPFGHSPAPEPETKSAHEAATSGAGTPPPLRPALDQAFSEAFGPPPPPGRPVTASGSRNMSPASLTPQARAVPPVRPAPGPPRPGAPALAQRPSTAPAITPTASSSSPNEARRSPEPGRPPVLSEVARTTPKLTLNIDSLEEEMAKLLGRPVEPPKP
jgi:hypothetical protein